MKNRSLISALALAGLLAGPVAAQEAAQDPAPKPASSTALARIQSTFRGADADGNNFIDGREAGKAGIPTRDFAAHDSDRDRRLSESEFLLYYRFLLIKARRPVDKDIETEVARIQAARRARQSQGAKKVSKPEPKDQRPVITVPVEALRTTPKPTADAKGSDGSEPAPAGGRLATTERLRRARANLSGPSSPSADAGTGSDEQTTAERASAMRLKQRSAEMRAKLAKQEEERRVAEAAELARRSEAMRLKTRAEAMRNKLAQEEAEQAASQKEKEELARRSEAMRLKTRSEAMRNKLAEEGRGGQAGSSQATDPESAGTRAQRYAARFVDAGLMTAKEGSELSKALSTGRIAALDPKQRSRLLSSLTRAQKAVGDKLAAGKIDKKEAASLQQLLDGHKKALVKEGTEKNPAALDSRPRPALGGAKGGTAKDGAGKDGAAKGLAPARPQEKPSGDKENKSQKDKNQKGKGQKKRDQG